MVLLIYQSSISASSHILVLALFLARCCGLLHYISSSKTGASSFRNLPSLILLGIHCTSSKTNVCRPEEANDMPKWHTDMNRHAKLNAINRSPKLEHGSEILFFIIPILCASILYPIQGIPRCSSYNLFACVV